MRVDHVSYAADQSGVKATAERLGEALGVTPVDGGIHPRFGTRNMILPLAHERYVEIVEVLDHPSSDKAPFGQVVRARSEAGGGWMGWVIRVDDDLESVEKRLDRQAVDGNRRLQDGREFLWKQIGIKGTLADPQLPFILRWADGQEDMHPSQAAEAQASIERLSIAGSPDRLAEWLGCEGEDVHVEDVNVEYVAPSGTPGIVSVTFRTPRGDVTL